MGLGSQAGISTVSAVQSQVLKVDIYDATWARRLDQLESAAFDYACVVADAAKSIGAIPMYTYYQMANNGDGNISVVNDATFMATYWSRMKVLFQRHWRALKTPALRQRRTDFWGYVELNAPGHDPNKIAASSAAIPIGRTAQYGPASGLCVIAMARKYASNAYMGFPPSAWGGNTNADVVDIHECGRSAKRGLHRRGNARPRCAVASKCRRNRPTAHAAAPATIGTRAIKRTRTSKTIWLQAQA